MAISNSLFFTVRPRPDVEEVGWQLKVMDRSDPSIVIAEFNEFVDFTFYIQVSAAGEGSVTLDLDTPIWKTTLGDGRPATDLLEYEYLWSAYENGALRMQWLGMTRRRTTVSESGARVAIIAGPGIAHVLTWAKVFPPGFPSVGTTATWPFTSSTPAMQVFLYLLNAAKTRGTIPWVTPTFTATYDSGGQTWTDVTTPFTALEPRKIELNSDLRTQLDIATGQDRDKHVGMRAEWQMWPGFQLDVRRTIGVHRESLVIFPEALVQTVERTSTSEDIANVVVIRDGHGKMSIATDSASVSSWNRREELQERTNILDAARKDQIAQVVLAQRKGVKSSWTVTVPYDQLGRRVFLDYGLGDWIGLSTTRSSGANQVTAYRVLGIGIQVDSTGYPTVELILETILDSRQRELEKRLTTIINTVENNPGIGVVTPTPPQPGVPVVWDPELGAWVPGEWQGGSGSGITVYVQPDPPTGASVGDFWIQTFPE